MIQVLVGRVGRKVPDPDLGQMDRKHNRLVSQGGGLGGLGFRGLRGLTVEAQQLETQ